MQIAEVTLEIVFNSVAETVADSWEIIESNRRVKIANKRILIKLIHTIHMTLFVCRACLSDIIE